MRWKHPARLFRSSSESSSRPRLATLSNCSTAVIARTIPRYAAADAEVRAMTVLYTQVGYISMRVVEPFAVRIARMPDYAAVFTGQRPSEAEIRRFRARHADKLSA